MTQNGRYRAEGRGYVMSGNVAAFSSTINFARLDDPTPSPSGNFGGGYSAVGNLVDQPGLFRNELLVGEGALGEPGNEELLGDVHFFDPVKAQALQSIFDPDQNPGSRFGAEVAALGDLNGDGFLDFAVAAPNFNGSVGTGQGRLYVFRSDNSPGPAPASAPPAPVAPPPPPAAAPGLQPQQRQPAQAAPRARLAPRLRVVRARLRGRRLDVLVTLTARASGRLSFSLRAARRTVRFSQRIVRRRVRVSRRVSRRQSRARRAALTVRYAGDSRVRPGTARARVVRARARR